MNRQFKILLINPPHIQKKGTFPRVVFEPLGLAYIAAYLEKQGHSVSILDAIGLGFDKFTDIDGDRQLVGLNYQDIAGSVRELSPDVVGIGVPFTVRAESALGVAAAVKQVDSRIVTILGGIHATSAPQQCLRNQNVDYVVCGEGEIPISNLLEALKNPSAADFKTVNGIGFKENGQVFVNPRQEPVENLDSLPMPARHLLPMDRYFNASKRFLTGRHGKKFACVATSRGCPFKCIFCESYKVMGRRWRFRSPANVVDEVEQLVKRYHVNFIHFEDDNFTLNRDRLLKICDLIIGRRLKIKWDTPNGVRADTIADEEVLSAMKKSGCCQLCVAPESGNQHVVTSVIRKNMNLEKVVEAVRLCKKVGIKVDAFFVIGFVEETKSQIEDTIEFAAKLRKLGVSRCHFHIATPFEGTELYEQARQKGYLVESPYGCIKLEAPRIQTPEYTVADIDRYFIEGCKTNSVFPADKIGLILFLLLRDPLRLIKTSCNYTFKRLGGLS